MAIVVQTAIFVDCGIREYQKKHNKNTETLILEGYNRRTDLNRVDAQGGPLGRGSWNSQACDCVVTVRTCYNEHCAVFFQFDVYL